MNERKLNVLVACEESQRVCTAFRSLGHEAFSCDIIEPSGGHPEWHIFGDALQYINPNSEGLIFFTDMRGGAAPSKKVGHNHSASSLHLYFKCRSLSIISA